MRCSVLCEHAQYLPMKNKEVICEIVKSRCVVLKVYTVTTEWRNTGIAGARRKAWKQDQDWIWKPDVESFDTLQLLIGVHDFSVGCWAWKRLGAGPQFPQWYIFSQPQCVVRLTLTNAMENRLSFSYSQIPSKQVFPFNIPKADWLFELHIASNSVNVRGLKLIPTFRCCFPLSPDGIELTLVRSL